MTQRGSRVLTALGCLSVAVAARAIDIDDLRQNVTRIREELAHQDDPKISPVSNVDQIMMDKYAADQAVTTKAGRLTVGGLVQIWFQYIKNDRLGIIRATPANNLDPSTGAGAFGSPIPEPNEVLDNDTLRVRRAELRFGLDVTDHIYTYVMIDMRREGDVTVSSFPANPNHNAVFTNPNSAGGFGQQRANFIVPQILQEAFIEFHDFVPHHDFRMGQFKPPTGEESYLRSDQLPFVDRSMIGTIHNLRDTGVMMHGSWFYKRKGELDSGRLQYWVGAYNGPDGTVLADPEILEGGNRSDDNSDKDIIWRISGQPIWELEKWSGRMEVGYSRTDGYRGESGDGSDPARAINGLNRERTAINRQDAYFWYRPNGP